MGVKWWTANGGVVITANMFPICYVVSIACFRGQSFAPASWGHGTTGSLGGGSGYSIARWRLRRKRANSLAAVVPSCKPFEYAVWLCEGRAMGHMGDISPHAVALGEEGDPSF